MNERGSALVEYALILPLMLLLLLNAINFGTYFFAWITINNASRAAAEYYIYNGAAIGFESIPQLFDSGQTSCGAGQTTVSPTSQSLCSVVAQETAYLPATSPALTVSVCRNNSSGSSATITCEAGGGTTSPPADPEPAQFVSTGVTVTYSYQPVFGIFTIPFLNVPLTLGPTTITRQVLMRSMW